jgi:multiple sugar transport system ATP-binding protein
VATITYQSVGKVYPDGTEAVAELDLDVDDGELMVLVGPSGCGKSTVLRMTAGLEEITSGGLLIDDEVMNAKQPQERDVAMVFQDYALYPHMTVRQNMGFALRMMKLPRDEISRRVVEAAERLSLNAQLDRRPKHLSGGQRQRVAMGRAIVREPKAFLMDEPLSNLDAKLRVQMRAEISALQKQLGTTMLYVTHDQVEAMTMGDRVAVLKNGYLQQCARPQELYDDPGNIFVAGFIGSPKMNLFQSQLRRDGDGSIWLRFGQQELHLPPDQVTARPGLRDRPEGAITVGIRPEGLHHAPDADAERSLDVTADVVEMLGPETLIYFVAPVEPASDTDVREQEEEESILAAHGTSVMCARLVPPVRLREGSAIRLAIDTKQLYFFDEEGNALGRAP